jgi:uncharacterized membrane protein
MPAILIRQLDNLRRVSSNADSASQRDVIARQAEMIMRASDESIPEECDRRDVRMAYDALMTELHPDGFPAGW